MDPYSEKEILLLSTQCYQFFLILFFFIVYYFMYMCQNVYAPCVCRYLLRPEEGDRVRVRGVLGGHAPPSVGAGHQVLAFRKSTSVPNLWTAPATCCCCCSVAALPTMQVSEMPWWAQHWVRLPDKSWLSFFSVFQSALRKFKGRVTFPCKGSTSLQTCCTHNGTQCQCGRQWVFRFQPVASLVLL